MTRGEKRGKTSGRGEALGQALARRLQLPRGRLDAFETSPHGVASKYDASASYRSPSAPPASGWSRPESTDSCNDYDRAQDVGKMKAVAIAHLQEHNIKMGDVDNEDHTADSDEGSAEEPPERGGGGFHGIRIDSKKETF